MAKTKNIQFDTMSLHGIDEDSELIPLMTPEDEEEINNEKLPETLAYIAVAQYCFVSWRGYSNYGR